MAAAATLAIAVPTLLAFNLPPSATFLNQAAALVGWGIFLLLLSQYAATERIIPRRGVAALLVGLTLLAAAAMVSSLFAAVPSALALSSVGLIAAAALTALGAAAAGRSDCAPTAFRAVCIALVVAGVLSVVVSIVQVFAPEWRSAGLIAHTSIEGRASGNLRQPNHLSSLLLWSLIAVLWLAESGRLKRLWAAALGLSLLFAIVLAASRTGVVGVAILALWGLLDRRLSRTTRAALILMPVAYALFFGGLTLWAHASDQVFGGEARLAETEGSPNSRLHIWSNTLSLITRQPWLGVGFGEFNFAWSLTPFPARPTAFFDHTHNLPLQFAVELGLPLAILVTALLVYALWRAFVAGRDAVEPARTTMLRAAFMMVLMIGVHSMFEYPLWYAYFLLPTAFAWGLCLGADARGPTAVDADPTRGKPSGRALALASLLMMAGGAFAVIDYLRVASIFSADERSVPLAQRIATGQRSWFFAHHAHYAAVTTAARPSDAMPSFKVATHYLLDTRLMMAWATALNESGDVERARHIAQRLKEFRNLDSKAFFAPCEAPPIAGEERPFQCTPPTKTFDFRDFR